MWFQIFPPSNSFLGHDGLYRIRKWIFAAWILLPTLAASLAFAAGGAPYQAAGAFCALPLRPYWYRLALSWVPRYLIWIFVMFVAIRIYLHVGKEFKVFGHERDRSSSLSIPGESTIDRVATKVAEHKRRKSLTAEHRDLEKLEPEGEIAPDDMSVRAIKSPGFPKASSPGSSDSPPLPSPRRPSVPDWSATFDFPIDPLTGPKSIKSNSSSRRGSRQIAAGVMAEDFAPPSAPDTTGHRGSVVTLGSVRSSGTNDGPALAPIMEDKRASAAVQDSLPPDAATQAMKLRRQAIQRQLKLLFIYPVVYIILWTIPFTVHLLNYQDRFAQRPIFPLSALSTFCQCFLGFADVFIFCWREKPWRHIPGSDATFFGSFLFWRFCFGSAWIQARRERRRSSYLPSSEKPDDDPKSQSRAGLLSSLKRWSMSMKGQSPRGSDASVSTPVPPPMPRPIVHRRAHSGGSDRRYLEAERAHERLAAERKDYEQQRRSLQERRESYVSMQNAAGNSPAKDRKEWWDQGGDAELFRDHEAA